MQGFDISQNDPNKFAQALRYLTYALLVVLFLVGIKSGIHVHYFFQLILLLVLTPLTQNKLLRMLPWHLSTATIQCLAYFIDAIITAVYILCFDQAIMPSLAAVLLFLLNGLWLQDNRKSLVIGIAVFVIAYCGLAIPFGVPLLQFTTHGMLLSVAAILCLSGRVVFGLVHAYQRIKYLSGLNTGLENQVNRYLILANKLSRYAPTQIWQSIIRGEHDVKIDNKRRKLTIFFSDIQGFTELSDRLPPDDLAFILNDYFENMSELARQYGGTIDKFMGDAILIFFGDPETKGAEEDACACLEMALAMRQQMKVLRQRWQHAGYDGLHIRIGITTGYCHVGNFGTSSRMSYTIVGRDANLAARLQTAAAVDQILISHDTYLLIQDRFICIPNGQLQLKGLSTPVMTWQVIAKKDHMGQSRWMDCELPGFNLQLDMDQLKFYEGDKIIQMLEQATKQVKMEIMQKSHDHHRFQKE